MEEQKTSLLDKIMVSKKRFIATLFVVAVVLAIPVTITMVNSQQDVRQRAAGMDCTQLLQYYNQYLSNCSGQNAPICQALQIQLTALHCNISPTATPSATLSPTAPASTISATITATSTPTVSITTTPSPTPGPLTGVQRLFDFNDDGKINEVDLNILYVGFAKRDGD